MPIYDFVCGGCKKPFEDIKSITEPAAGRFAICPSCAHECCPDDRDYSHSSFNFIGTAVSSPEYNPGLGGVVKNQYHKSELLKKKNLVEVGNDFGSGEKMQKHFETRKIEEREKRWREVD